MKLLSILALLALAPVAMAQDTANPNSTSNSKDKAYEDGLDHKGF